MARQSKKTDTTANLGFEAKLWAAADALRNNMDAAEYKHVVLGLIFLKYISDAFEAKHAELAAQQAEGADPEDRDEYRAASIFWVPKEARWQHLKANAPQSTIGTLVDDAMAAIERDNPTLKGVLPKDFGRAGLDKQRLGQIINLVSDIALGSAADRAKDTLGRVYEYFLSRFASAEGKSGGQFYTPSHVVRVLVGTDGRVKAVEAVSASENAFLDATREQALRKWRFTPAMSDGAPIEAWREMTVRFVLPD